MTFTRFAVITALCALLCVSAFGQTSTTSPSVLPTYVGLGAAFNQIGTPRTNLWATAIYPVASSVGVYSSTTTDIIPIQKINPATGKPYYAFTTSIRQGIHKTIFTSGKFVLLLGGDAGVGLSQADPSGVNVALSAAFTGTAIYQVSPKWAIVAPVRGVYAGGAWNLIPEFGVLFKP